MSDQPLDQLDTRHKDLEREILVIADREKERLGRELHDGLCQTLAGIAALSATLSRKLAANSELEASAAAAEITKLLNAAIGEAHDLAHGLGPVGLREAGLDGTLEGLALSVQHMHRVTCTLESERSFPELGHETAAHLFRIAQEAVNNALAHGRADRIEISLGAMHGEGRLSVLDNGVGLPAELPQGGGIGLRTMAYRARLIGGFVEVGRQAAGGTAMTCVFPFAAMPESREDPDHARDDH